ncbi:hypothetical protein CB1_001603008 [Camelus ferus]|nr:hypothetical protein CB1_001603008 [Camelus ferus]
MVPRAHLLVYYIVTGEQAAELVSDSVCLNIEEKCGNQLQVLQSLDKSNQDCGASDGMNNAEVFYLAGLTVLTNANADDSQQDASTFKHSLIQKCCYHGAYRGEKTCEERAARITIHPKCARAFTQCCNLATKLRMETYILVNMRRRGLCVADVLRLQVQEDDFLTINNNVTRVN